MNLPCKVCNGAKTVHFDGFTTEAGEVYPPNDRPCISCQGKGEFPPIDEGFIRNRILATKGKNKGKIRASMVSPFRAEGFEESRAYYVWRLARFHGGKDVTMPMTADMMVRGDPFKPELDKLSDIVAKECFGTDLAAAARWGRAFGII